MNGIKHRTAPFKGIKKLGLINLIASTGLALVGTVWAIYLESFLKNPAYVGFLSSFFTIIAILSYFIIVPLIEKKSKSVLYLYSLFGYAISYILFGILSNLYAIILLGIFLSFLSSLKVTSFGILVRDKSKETTVAKNEGLIYTSLNLAWLIGPLIAGFIAQEYGIRYVFFIAAFLVLITTQLFKSFDVKDNRVSKKVDKNILKVFLSFFKDKNRVFAYIISGGVNFWWALIYIYIPIYIIESGLSDLIVGYFLFAVIIPLILSEYYFCKLSSRIGFKKIFTLSYFLLAFLCLIIFFIPNIYGILGLVILAGFAVAMIEPTTEAYFLDIITKNQRDKYYGPYTTAIDVGHYAATFFGAIILLFFAFKFIFLLYAAFMLMFMLFSTKIKDVVEIKKHK